MSSSNDRNVAAIIVIVLAAFVVLNIVSYIWFPFLPWFEEREAGTETVEQTYDAEQAIENYEWFRQQYQDIQAQREAIQNNRDALERFYDTWGESPTEGPEWTRQAQERHNRIQQRITGNQQALETMVADYNARSQQANNELFKCHLPYQVDERFAISGPPGSGAPEQPADTDVNGEPVDRDADIPDASQCDGLPDQIQNAA